jgi:hypothetical protein
MRIAGNPANASANAPIAQRFRSHRTVFARAALASVMSVLLLPGGSMPADY